ncbi:GDSL-LIKE LIPASE/ACYLHYDROLASE [Salix koriyanagi]|uniref:GDSL-LIKE LIPASE/ACYLHYDROLASE n=1 Tax=Salix koriyanagi TaxID=2511006 RepID=A0A9Q1A514_9ROSI|nr:GDSL-LIKE LIPASE/ACYLHYDROLASE [Salix koriyanagi]
MAPSILLLTLVAVCSISEAATLPKFSGILIFGDSTVDTGNNNYVKTMFRGDHPPYGQDFPDHVPTGRFSNGKLIPDLVASILGMKETVPPFLNRSLTDDDIRTGVCFASAGSGYDEMTTAVTGAIPNSYITRLKGIVGVKEARKILGGALIIVSSGTNDLVFNYYDIPTRRNQFNTISGYHDFLLNSLQNFVQELYNLGGRLMAIAGLPPIGCLPIQIPKLPGSRIIYADIYDPLSDMVSQPQKYGFVETHRGCCGTGVVEAGSTCNKVTPTCGNASRFMFWDAIHPSESAYKFLTEYLEKSVFSQFNSI